MAIKQPGLGYLQLIVMRETKLAFDLDVLRCPRCAGRMELTILSCLVSWANAGGANAAG